MKQCKCVSMAFNLAREGVDQGDLCDRHYWQDRAEKAEKDAARYRWLRDSRDSGACLRLLMEEPLDAPCDYDAAIDVAIAKDAP